MIPALLATMHVLPLPSMYIGERNMSRLTTCYWSCVAVAFCSSSCRAHCATTNETAPHAKASVLVLSRGVPEVAGCACREHAIRVEVGRGWQRNGCRGCVGSDAGGAGGTAGDL